MVQLKDQDIREFLRRAVPHRITNPFMLKISPYRKEKFLENSHRCDV